MNERTRCRALAALPIALVLSGCEIITEPPRGWNTNWVVPGEEVSISVDSLLPGSVQVAPGGALFLVDISGVTLSRRLGDMCAPCAAFVTPTVVPKPAFSDSVTATIPLPADVVSLQLAGGGTTLDLGNGLSFDPIDPPGATSTGFMRMRVESGAATLASAQVDGATTSFAPGDTLIRSLDFASATVAGALDVDFVLDSPAGDDVTIDANDSIRVVVRPGQVQVSSITLNVPAQSLSSSATLDVVVDSYVHDHVHGGGLTLHIDNDFDVTGDFTVRITATGMAPIQRSFSVMPGASTQSVAFTAAEMRALLSQQVTLEITGVLDAGTVTVTPGQELNVRSEINIVVGPRAEEGN